MLFLHARAAGISGVNRRRSLSRSRPSKLSSVVNTDRVLGTAGDARSDADRPPAGICASTGPVTDVTPLLTKLTEAMLANVVELLKGTSANSAPLVPPDKHTPSCTTGVRTSPAASAKAVDALHDASGSMAAALMTREIVVPCTVTVTSTSPAVEPYVSVVFAWPFASVFVDDGETDAVPRVT